MMKIWWKLAKWWLKIWWKLAKTLKKFGGNRQNGKINLVEINFFSNFAP